MSNWLRAILQSASGTGRRPATGAGLESSISGLYIAGDLAGAPVMKLAMEQGREVARHILALPDARGADAAVWDVVVAGAGAAGLSCALELLAGGLRVLVLEKGCIAQTIEDFPEQKWIYDEPAGVPATGRLWLEGASKEDLLARWRQDVAAAGLIVRTGEGVSGLIVHRQGGFGVRTPSATYSCRRFVLATGQRANPRRLDVPGEDLPHVHHRLYSPGHYQDEQIAVIGGGNSAVEAALALSAGNRVTLIHRGEGFDRVFRENRRQLGEAIAAGRIETRLQTIVREFTVGGVRTSTGEISCDRTFVLIGAEPPEAFLKSLGIRLENEWSGNWGISLALLAGAFAGMGIFHGSQTAGLLLTLSALAGLAWHGRRGCRWSWLALSFFLFYSIYANKRAPGHEFWPYQGWGAQALAFFGRPFGFWYTVLYTLVLTGFGVESLIKWGIRRRDRFQTRRFATLIGFQWLFYFLIPEFLFRAWVTNPALQSEAWRSYGIIYAWPLFLHTFFGNPHPVWIVWGLLLTFVLIPVLVLFHGKRYCSWVCGCGGLAETFGDRWRHLAPKGRQSIRLEQMGGWILAAVAVLTLAVALGGTFTALRSPAQTALDWYGLLVDVWLVGLLPMTLYPFLGGKIWCRYWCPLAKMMELLSAWFTRLRISRFAIYSNDKCIACGECSRYCQVGIDVMRFAMRQEQVDNLNSSCIGCGICVTVCPMEVLSYDRPGTPVLVQIEPGR
ncbi:MAG: NAD(P)-binding domain-containing protein [Acidobacteria bacterium]|nr:NAD(P)-binding domain-containing protein [Acidobacteriota bacterium]